MPMRTSAGWIEEYKRKEALWFHDGNLDRPHALLTSGNHSSGFFNSRPVIEDEALLREAASDLVDRLIELGGSIQSPDCVVGPQTGATKLAEFVAKEIERRRGRPCQWASPAKAGEGKDKKMIFDDPNPLFLFSKIVLLIEDVLTTGGSVELTNEAVEAAGGWAQPFILVLVNRSGMTEVNGRKIVALIDQEMPIWPPAECPLCPKSEAIRPKGENWARLNATY